MPEPFYIVGPTAVGKSEVAAEIAVAIGGEVIGADAFQVYRGLDVLTAKPDSAALKRVPHHLIGEIPLTQSFDVAQYREIASARIAAIANRGRVPVIVGGTGLYVRALTHGLAALPPADEALRAQLGEQPLAALQQQLRELDPAGAVHIDLHNPRRVIRALEVCLLTGRPFSSFRLQSKPAHPVRGVLLQRDRNALRERVTRRTEQMFAAGVVEEVRSVTEISPTAEQAIGFLEIRTLLSGKMDEAECRHRITLQTQQYAKRQMTWFRRSSAWQIVNLREETQPAEAVRDLINAPAV